MGFVRLGEREASSEVQFHVLLQILLEGVIDGFGSSKASLGGLLHLFFAEELSAALVSFALCLSFEESVINLGDINSFKINGGLGRDGVNLVDALEGNAINLVGASDQEHAGGKLLEENDSLATEASGEEDKNLTGLDAASELGSLSFFSSDGA